MESKVVTNSIYHITSDFEIVKKILQDRAFKVSYCKEVLYYSLGSEKVSLSYEYAIPMISFCDIPVNQKTTYGDFRIGLKLSWAIKNKLNPVLYVDRNSKVSTGIWRILNKTISDREPKVDEAATYLLQLMKNREEKITRKNEIEKIDFYKEREWRYVPDIDPEDKAKFPDYIYHSDYDSKLVPLGCKPHMTEEKYWLQFDLDDITCIIVKENEQVNLIRDLFPDNEEKKKILAVTKSLNK